MSPDPRGLVLRSPRPRVVGRCPECRRVFALTPHGLLTRHGWARLGQAQEGPCPGSGGKPFTPGAPSTKTLEDSGRGAGEEGGS